MWSTAFDAITAAAAWPWLDPLTTVLHTVGSVLGLAVTVRQMIQWQRDQHRGRAVGRYRRRR
ncbi:hypothetical protein [Kutzneria chonburiensis]|uniref:Uncharacterized protein n=1 Tax=Kutzneria chonburiensis TaxID=1483604 RepID=A0ABV6MRZ5_9PSEU|nr:hypothetical protein [Kutzneria chonburiensis]